MREYSSWPESLTLILAIIGHDVLLSTFTACDKINLPALLCENQISQNRFVPVRLNRLTGQTQSVYGLNLAVMSEPLP